MSQQNTLTNGHSNGQKHIKPKRLFGYLMNGSYNTELTNGKLTDDDDTIQYNARKLGEPSNYVGVALLLLVFGVIFGKLLLYMGLENISLKAVAVTSWETTQTYIVKAFENVNSSDVKNGVCSILVCGFIGFLVTAFSWMMVFLDSDIPGINPPTPMSPRKNRTGYSMHVKNSYSLGYLMTIVNGFAVFMFLLFAI